MTSRERKRRGNSRYFLLFFLCLIGIGALGWGAYKLLTGLDSIDLRKVELSGNHAIPDSLIYEITDPYLGQNLFAISGKALEKKLQGFSRIKQVKIRKSPFHTLKIQIEERVGVLYAKSIEGDLFPIDANGVVLKSYSSYPLEDLPIATTYIPSEKMLFGKKPGNPDLQRILKLHNRIKKESPDFVDRISEYYTIDNTIYIVDAETGTRLIPSTEQLADQLRRYLFVQENGNIGKYKVVDLRYENQVVVKAEN